MGLPATFILFSLFTMVSAAAPRTFDPLTSDLTSAMSEMRSKSYYGFVILLDMLNETTKDALRQATFLMPSDDHLAKSPVSPNQLEEFVLSHTIPLPLVYNQLARTPPGTLIPSFISNRFFKISSLRTSIFLNNAHIIEPNVCSSPLIQCHGINAVIASRDYGIASPPPIIPPAKPPTSHQHHRNVSAPPRDPHSSHTAPPSDRDRRFFHSPHPAPPLDHDRRISHSYHAPPSDHDRKGVKKLNNLRTNLFT
ncbi:hypothetical protein ACHQM5_025543 [Ranunculus cassubicifolius]